MASFPISLTGERVFQVVDYSLHRRTISWRGGRILDQPLFQTLDRFLTLAHGAPAAPAGAHVVVARPNFLPNPLDALLDFAGNPSRTASHLASHPTRTAHDRATRSLDAANESFGNRLQALADLLSDGADAPTDRTRRAAQPAKQPLGHELDRHDGARGQRTGKQPAGVAELHPLEEL